MSQLAKKKADRIDLRIDEEAKQVIERAASLVGMSVSTFTLSTALRAAREEIAAYERITLSDRDRDLFLMAMTAPGQPNEALRRAMARYRKSRK